MLIFSSFFRSFFSSCWFNLTNIFPALRDHNENNTFLHVFVLSLPYVVYNLQSLH